MHSWSLFLERDDQNCVLTRVGYFNGVWVRRSTWDDPPIMVHLHREVFVGFIASEQGTLPI